MVTSDLIIIGAGPAGYETAIAAAREGLRPVLIECKSLGGTCLNEGCIPTKSLCRSAEIFDLFKSAVAFGVKAEEVSMELSAVVDRKNAVVSQLQEGVRVLLDKSGIQLVDGQAHFVGPHQIQVGNNTYESSHILIATGSEPKKLSIPGTDLPGVVTSSELLNLTEIPSRLCIIGGGVIGMEFASIFKSFGSEVVILEYAKEILPTFDRDLAKRLRTALKRRGIVFHTGAAVERIESDTDGLRVTYALGDKHEEIGAEIVLMSVGRSPRVSSLGLDKVGITHTPRGIVVDENMQTSVGGVYAVGDVNGICPLAHAAKAQGRLALSHLLGKGLISDMRYVPAAVFTVPEVATVGLTEEEAKNKSIEYTIRKIFYRANGKALTMGTDDGLIKLLVGVDNRIIGTHIMGAHAADIIHELALAMHLNATLSQVSSLIHAHPSLSEMVGEITEC